MNTEQVAFIKKTQREFFEKFNFKLEIDWQSMVGKDPSPESPVNKRRAYNFTRVYDEVAIKKELNKICKTFKANLKVLKTNRCTRSSNVNEWKALRMFSHYVISSNLNIEKCGELINKDRTVFYHHAKNVENELNNN
jgi:hypothetical protein